MARAREVCDVRCLLESNPLVRHYRLAGNDSGGWGATIVILADS